MKEIKEITKKYHDRLTVINTELSQLEKQINATEKTDEVCKAIKEKILNSCVLAFSELDNKKQLLNEILEDLYCLGENKKDN